MTITADDIVTKVCQLSSLYQLSQEREQLGEPCLLLMYVGDGTVLGSDDSEKAEAARFLREADFMTAVVSEGDISDELASAADLVLRADETDEYVAKLFKDKTKKADKGDKRLLHQGAYSSCGGGTCHRVKSLLPTDG